MIGNSYIGGILPPNLQTPIIVALASRRPLQANEQGTWVSMRGRFQPEGLGELVPTGRQKRDPAVRGDWLGLLNGAFRTISFGIRPESRERP